MVKVRATIIITIYVELIQAREQVITQSQPTVQRPACSRGVLRWMVLSTISTTTRRQALAAAWTNLVTSAVRLLHSSAMVIGSRISLRQVTHGRTHSLLLGTSTRETLFEFRCVTLAHRVLFRILQAICNTSHCALVTRLLSGLHQRLRSTIAAMTAATSL